MNTEDSIWRGVAEEIHLLLLIREGEFSWVTNTKRSGIPVTYIRIYSQEYGGGHCIKTTILFSQDSVEITHQTSIEPPKFINKYFDLTDPKSLDTIFCWLRTYGLVSESTELRDVI